MLDKTGNVRVTWHWSAFAQPLLQWKSNEYYTTCVCARAALGVQHAMRLRRVLCGLPRFATFFFTLYMERVKKKEVFQLKRCVSSFSTTFVWNIFHSKKKWARYDKKLHESSSLHFGKHRNVCIYGTLLQSSGKKTAIRYYVIVLSILGDRGSTVVKVRCYKSEVSLVRFQMVSLGFLLT